MINNSTQLLPRRTWWAALGMILIIAAALRLTGYNFSLPYIDHPDEPAYMLSARMVIDSGSPKPLGMHGYPPGIIALDYLVLRLLQNPADPPTSLVEVVRLISITFSIGTIALLALTVQRVSTPLSGLIAAVFWSFSPTAIEFSRFATADNFVTFFSLCGLFFTLTGTQVKNEHHIRLGIYATLLAIVFKYQAVLILPIILAFPLTSLLTANNERIAILRSSVNSLIPVLIFFFWLVFLFPALEASQSPYWSAAGDRFGFPTPQVIYANLRMVMQMIAPDVLWLSGWAGLSLLFLPEIRKHVSLLGLAALLFTGIAWLCGVSLYGDLGQQEFRQFMTAGVLMCGIAGLGFGLWAVRIAQFARRLDLRMPMVAQIETVVMGGLVLILLIPQIRASVENARQHTLPDRRNDLALYMDTSVPSGSYISGADNHKTFNRDWGGYSGTTLFSLFQMTSLLEQPVDDWRAQGVEYAILSWDEYRQLNERDEDQIERPAQTLLLKQYPQSPEYRDQGMVVLRLTPIETALPESTRLGSVQYVGYDLDQTSIADGTAVTFRIYWRATQALDCDAKVFNHLVDTETGTLVTQIDGDPVSPRRPTTTWTDPTETLISQSFTLSIPSPLDSQSYTLETGFYCPLSAQRLIGEDGSDSISLFTLAVVRES